MKVGIRFGDFVRAVTGHSPYPYQERLAHEGLPELLRAPTGAGKTAASALAWLYRRRLHPDPAVRTSTPHWLVFVLPMRVLVEQTATAVDRWLTSAGLAEDVGLHVIMGGEGRRSGAWRERAERDAVFVGTLDMLLSRALNRGYGESRFAWPITFGLFNAGCQWVFDEVQLMGPALPTSRQLEALRRSLGMAMPCASMWMSATVHERWLSTVDMPTIESVHELGPEDRTGTLGTRLAATKRVREVTVDQKRSTASVAETLLEEHRAGTLTIAVLNTVERARDLFWRLDRARPQAELLLLHSRFRPIDRAERLQSALFPVDPNGPGRIIVSTQVLEAGVDISATTLFTEAAPWPSIVQRAGRCNREGEASDAVLLWARPPRHPPYADDDVAAAADALAGLEGVDVTPTALADVVVPVTDPVHPVLRRRDLLGLFDTAPDLSGNDIDVGRFLRESGDLDVQVAWREVGRTGPGPTDPAPTRDELCPVPVEEIRKELEKDGRAVWRFDHLASEWVPVRAPADVRPGQVLVLRADQGGYSSVAGWDPRSTSAVDPVSGDEPPLGEVAEGTGDDPLTAIHRWVPLLEHLSDVEAEVRALALALNATGLGPSHLEAAAQAGRLHDLGKAHEVFQRSLLRIAEEGRRAEIEAGQPWAKSASRAPIRHERRHFRHELVSALALLEAGNGLLDETDEPDLVAYLVASHHGRVRLAIRSLAGEDPHPAGTERRVALGVRDGDLLPAVQLPGGQLPETVLDLSVMEMGDGDGGRPSWTRRALALRDRADLGPFRLAFLEGLVRLADWRVSARG